MNAYYKSVEKGKSPDSFWTIESYSEEITTAGIIFKIKHLIDLTFWSFFNYILCEVFIRVKTFFIMLENKYKKVLLKINKTCNENIVTLIGN